MFFDVLLSYFFNHYLMHLPSRNADLARSSFRYGPHNRLQIWIFLDKYPSQLSPQIFVSILSPWSPILRHIWKHDLAGSVYICYIPERLDKFDLFNSFLSFSGDFVQTQGISLLDYGVDISKAPRVELWCREGYIDKRYCSKVFD